MPSSKAIFDRVGVMIAAKARKRAKESRPLTRQVPFPLYIPMATTGEARTFQPMPNREHPETWQQFMDRMLAENPDYDLAYLLEDYTSVASILDPNSAMNNLNPYYQGEIPKAPETTTWQCVWCGSAQPKDRLSCAQCGGSHERQNLVP